MARSGLREHRETYPAGEQGLVFANSVGKALRRTLFRIRVWRPSLVRAGMLGDLALVDEDTGRATWTDDTETVHFQGVPERTRGGQASRRRRGWWAGFHGLRPTRRGSLMTGVPINMVQQVMGHERSSTTLDLYTRQMHGHDRILQALGGDEDDPDEVCAAGLSAPTR